MLTSGLVDVMVVGPGVKDGSLVRGAKVGSLVGFLVKYDAVAFYRD